MWPAARCQEAVPTTHAVWLLPRPQRGQRHRNRVSVAGDGSRELMSAQATLCWGFTVSSSLHTLLWGSRQLWDPPSSPLTQQPGFPEKAPPACCNGEARHGRPQPARSGGSPQDLTAPRANTEGTLGLIHGKWHILVMKLLSNQIWFISQQVRSAEGAIIMIFLNKRPAWVLHPLTTLPQLTSHSEIGLKHPPAAHHLCMSAAQAQARGLET